MLLGGREKLSRGARLRRAARASDLATGLAPRGRRSSSTSPTSRSSGRGAASGLRRRRWQRASRTQARTFASARPFAPLDRPALAVIGSGKRVGKTAVTGHVARLLAEDHDLVVVAMGRGGPREPVVTGGAPTVDDFLALSRAGQPCGLRLPGGRGARGCGHRGRPPLRRRARGRPFTSNVEEAAQLAASLEPDLVLLEGAAPRSRRSRPRAASRGGRSSGS